MPESSTIVAFIGAVVVLSVTPGPDMALLVTRGISQGRKAACLTALGFALAGVVQLPLLALGVAAVIQSSPLALDAIRYVGAAYLLWRGVHLIRNASGVSMNAPGRRPATALWALRDGVIASLTNPKGMIFLLAFLPQFIDPAEGPVGLQLFLLGLLMKSTALIVESGIAIAAARVGSLVARAPETVIWLERVSGVVLIGLGLRLAAMERLGR
ncbi:LysE family translocator [Mesorhizobium sp.]|uniref:LysE family translocator n=1 Tax=Mesorhizobium sp. TaxID=1871066 RepID=UPI0025E803D7|nr:LysE family translocator [Mesorhizobium sp.]